MKHQTALIAIVTFVALGSASGPIAAERAPNSKLMAAVADAAGSAVDRQQTGSPEVYGADSPTEARIRGAFERFDRAGLTLPHLRIYVHESPEGCGGWLGLFDGDGSGNRVDLCGDVLLHELAHAWEHHNMAETTREAFLEHANLEVWNHRDTPHPARGIEHAANVIAWGLNTRPLDAGKVDLYAEHLYRFELLTGRPSPRIAHLVAGPHGAVEPVAPLEPAVAVLAAPGQAGLR